MLPKGTFKAKCVDSQLGFAETGTEQVALTFEITEEGEFEGASATWFGFFTEATAERTVQALRVCGWTGEDLSKLDGLDGNEVELVIDHDEPYNGKLVSRVKWINRLGGGRVVLKHQMNAAQKSDLSKRFMGLVLASKKADAQGAPAPAQKPSPRPAPATNGAKASYPDDWDGQGL